MCCPRERESKELGTGWQVGPYTSALAAFSPSPNSPCLPSDIDLTSGQHKSPPHLYKLLVGIRLLFVRP